MELELNHRLKDQAFRQLIAANATTTIYALAYDSLSNASTCTSMLSFVHDSMAPTVPAFSSTNPASPSSSSTTPALLLVQLRPTL
ncbi:MAG: hypothetical protein U0T83_06395 [Bacteriovoracaceae bacterium]